MQTLCTMCGQNAAEFDRYGNGFEEHVREEHNMWHYLQFFVYLDRKDPTEDSAQEGYVRELVRARWRENRQRGCLTRTRTHTRTNSHTRFLCVSLCLSVSLCLCLCVSVSVFSPFLSLPLSVRH